MLCLTLSFLAIFNAQDDASQIVRSLIGKLGAERVEARDRAMYELRMLGRAAIPYLEKAILQPDPEIRARVLPLLLQARTQVDVSFEERLLATLPEGYPVQKPGHEFPTWITYASDGRHVAYMLGINGKGVVLCPSGKRA